MRSLAEGVRKFVFLKKAIASFGLARQLTADENTI